jgi:hypothetical protein
MEMRLFVYVHERNNVCEVEKLAVPTGLGSVIGNKVHRHGSIEHIARLSKLGI